MEVNNMKNALYELIWDTLNQGCHQVGLDYIDELHNVNEEINRGEFYDWEQLNDKEIVIFKTCVDGYILDEYSDLQYEILNMLNVEIGRLQEDWEHDNLSPEDYAKALQNYGEVSKIMTSLSRLSGVHKDAENLLNKWRKNVK